jgi:RNA polymerase sigma-70 factor (ECF subfamily)
LNSGIGKQGDCETDRERENERDIACVIRTREQDVNAFEDIVRRYTPMFFSLAQQLMGYRHADEIEQVVQEIFIRIFTNLKKFDTSKRFYPWAYTIAINYIRTERRKKRRIKELPYRDELLQTGGHGIADPSEAVIAKQARTDVHKALWTVKKKYRDTFVLRVIEGLSVAETAKALRISESAVKIHLFRAKKQLKNLLLEKEWK